MLFPPSGYIFPPCIQSPEKSLVPSLRECLHMNSRFYESITVKILSKWYCLALHVHLLTAL